MALADPYKVAGGDSDDDTDEASDTSGPMDGSDEPQTPDIIHVGNDELLEMSNSSARTCSSSSSGGARCFGHEHAWQSISNRSAVCFGVPYDVYEDSDDDDDGRGPSDEILFSHEKYFSPRLLELLKGSLSGGDPASTTGLLSGVYPMLLHQTQSPHPERPSRMVVIYHEIIEQGLDKRCKLVPVRAASAADCELVHSRRQVRRASGRYETDEAASEALGIDPDTYFSGSASGHAAMLSAGSVTELTTRIVQGELQNAFAISRPPGHHCEQGQAMGFCLLNNVCVAVAAVRERLGVGRVMILDWDVHHGNGVQHIFEDDPDVLYVSTHRFGSGFYPGTGHPSEVGQGAGVGKTVNMAFTRPGMGDLEYLAAFDRLIMPVAREYQPELVVVSAGFDAALGDPLGGMTLSPAGYAQMTSRLLTLARGRLLLSLEGGYDLRAISRAAAACLHVLLGDTPPPVARGDVRVEALHDIEIAVAALTPYWKCLQVQQQQGQHMGQHMRQPHPAKPRLSREERLARKAIRRRIRRRLHLTRGPWWHRY